ncbi:unnamed protein product, partial [Mesorhabditis belari]|uniref:CUB domain-containing protein n=1 Tax=Mesorhabditis belari TaxID=2138241 RepID=A0AAF3J1K4_9BILA
MRRFSVFLIFSLLVCLTLATREKKLGRKNQPKDRKMRPHVEGFLGCPYNNDFYYNGVIASPLYPKNYPKDDKCWYYMQAKPGYVLSFNFTHFDLDTLDFVTIYDGPSDISPILAQIGGPNGTTQTPKGIYYSSERHALVTFTSNLKSTPKSGFSFEYKSVFTSYPCNRDILLGINAMGGLKSQGNYLRQISFIGNYLVKNWTVGLDQTRVFINLQTDADYALVYPATDPEMTTTAGVQEVILNLSEYADNVVDNDTVTDFNGMFRYLESDISIDPADNGERAYTQKVVILFIASNPNDDQDYYEALEYAHIMRTTEDTKVITVAMGSDLDVAKIGKLSYGEGFYFGADYSNLPSLTDKINAAICADIDTKCGV